MRALLFLVLISLATTLALGGCANIGDLMSPAKLETDAKNIAKDAVKTVEADVEADVVASASNPSAAAAAVTSTSTGLNQIGAAHHLSPAQVAQLQAILNQGTANDKQMGLTPQQQAQNTQRRIAILKAILGQPGLVAGQ